MTTPNTRQHTAVLHSLARNQRNTGWALVMATRPQMQYPDTFYVNDNDRNPALLEQVQGLEAGAYLTLTLSRGRLKPGRAEGSTNDWDYYENIVGIKAADQAATPPVQAAQAPERAVAPLDQRITWNSAINNATNLMASVWVADKTIEGAEIQVNILGWAAWYYAAIVAGPPAAMPQERDTSADIPAAAPRKPAQPPEAPEPPRTPAALPTAAQGRATVVRQHNESLAAQAPQRPDMAQCPLREHGGAPMRNMPSFQDQRPCHPVNVMEGGKQVLDHWCWGEAQS